VKQVSLTSLEQIRRINVGVTYTTYRMVRITCSRFDHFHHEQDVKISTHFSLIGSHVQDSYCLRCIPQVHGVVIDTIKFVRGILKTEVNSTLDNPVCHLLLSMNAAIVVMVTM